MTREILFRGFHEAENGSTTIYVDGRAVKGEWVEGLPCYSWEDRTADKGEIKLTKEAYIGCIEALDERHNRIWAVIPSTVGQFTGLDDKNGRKIFGGDECILTVFSYDGSDSQHLCEIGYDSGYFFVGNDTNFYVALRDVEDTETDIIITGTIFDKEATP